MPPGPLLTVSVQAARRSQLRRPDMAARTVRDRVAPTSDCFLCCSYAWDADRRVGTQVRMEEAICVPIKSN